MAFSIVQFIGDGTSTTYSFSFPYIDSSHIEVSVGGVPAAYTLTNTNTITLATAPAVGAFITIARNTPKSAVPVDFSDGSILREADLDVLAVFSTYVAQETYDRADDALGYDSTDGSWDAVERKIKNVAAPVAAGDAVNKGTIDSLYPYVATVAGAIAKVNTVGDAISKVGTVADNITSVNTVALNNTNVSKVAAIDARVTTVANNDANVTAVADIDANVTTVAGVSPKVTTVANNIVKVVAVADNTTNINAVFDNASNITAVAGNTSNINSVFGNATNINSVVANAPNINAVAANAPNINAVFANGSNIAAAVSNETNINAVVANAPNIDAVFANASNITAVAGNETNINAVVTNAPNINTVADNIGVVNTVVTNLAAIQDAPQQASDAAASAVSAAQSAASAATLLDNFDDRYLGAKASDPAVDNDGDPLIVGALYFNTADGVMRIYTDSGWLAASSASVVTLDTYEFVATSGQTAFTGLDANGITLSYTAPSLLVTLNGVRLRPGDDYTATDGVTVTLATGATTGDELVVDAFGNFLVADVVSRAAGGTFQSAVNVLGNMDATSFTVGGAPLPAANPIDSWPVGSVFISVVATNPNTLLGGGTWVAFGAGRVLVGIDAGQTEFDTVEEVGGAKTHTLTTAEMPSHTHGITAGTVDYDAAGATAVQGRLGVATSLSTGAAGSNGAHNNLQPYIVCHFWKRTA